MRSKAPLVLMEQMVMLLVFALAAALCLQAFVKSEELSKHGEARDRAVVLCQSAAEVLHSTGGDFSAAAEKLEATRHDRDSFQIFYGEDWRPGVMTSPNVYPFGYTLGASRLETDVPGLGKAAVWVQADETGEELFRLEVAWQEVNVRD